VEARTNYVKPSKKKDIAFLEKDAILGMF